MPTPTKNTIIKTGNKNNKGAGMGNRMSLGWAEFVSYWANWTLLGALLIGLVATYGIVVSSNVKKQQFKLSVANADARALEEKLALEKFKQARELTPEQLSIISKRAEKYSGTIFDAGAASTDPEYLLLLRQIIGALKGANWVQVDWQGPGATINNAPGQSLGLVSVAGVAFFVSPDAKPELAAVASEMVICLNEKEIGIEANAGRLAVSGNINATIIHVMVGRKL